MEIVETHEQQRKSIPFFDPQVFLARFASQTGECVSGRLLQTVLLALYSEK